MRARNATIVIALAALVGLLDAGLLTWDHQAHRIDPTITSEVCGQGEGCDIARFHPLSEISLGSERPGLPISLLAIGAYLACLSLAVRRWRFRQERDSPRLLLAIALGSALYSAFLAFVSLMVQGTLCKLCTVLYVVNFILLVASVVGLGESMSSWAAGFIDAVRSRAAAAAAVPMIATLIGGYALYAPPVAEAQAARVQALIDEAQNLPAQPILAIDVSDRPSTGPADAPVHAVEFADFGCGHCRMLFAQLHHYMEAHPGELRVTFVNYPLNSDCNPAMGKPYHAAGCMLGAASECAHAQGKWEALVPYLFERASSLDSSSLLALAASVGLDGNTFHACMNDPATLERVKADAELGIKAGVDGTPTFLLNGRRVIGGRPQPVLEAMITAIKEAK
ncbi:MAG: vitamin K epoxide reductase family protein [Myxococcota bacterium]